MQSAVKLLITRLKSHENARVQYHVRSGFGTRKNAGKPRLIGPYAVLTSQAILGYIWDRAVLTQIMSNLPFRILNQAMKHETF